MLRAYKCASSSQPYTTKGVLGKGFPSLENIVSHGAKPQEKEPLNAVPFLLNRNTPKWAVMQENAWPSNDVASVAANRSLWDKISA